MYDLDTPTAPAAEKPAAPSGLLPLQSQRSHLELLSHLSAYSELLVLVCGDAGAGKTTLARMLQHQRLGLEETLLLIANPGMGWEQLLGQIVSALEYTGLSQQRAEALDELKALLLERYKEGGGLVVMLDDADALSAETLNDISYLALLAPQQLSFVLLGRDGFERQLRSGPTSAPTHVVQLEPLPEVDAIALLQHKFAGLTDCQAKAVYNSSTGFPADLLARVPDQSPSQAAELRADDAKPSASVRARFPLWHIVAVALVGTATVMSFLYQSKPEATAKPTAEQILQDLELSNLNGISTEPNAVDFNYPASEQGNAPIDSAEMSVVDAEVPPVATTEPAPTAKSQSTTIAADPNKAPSVEPSLPQREAAAAKVAAPQSTLEPETRQAEAAASDSQNSDARQLLTAQGFVIQVLGVKNRSAAEAFIARWQERVPQRLYLYQSTYQGEPWYVVVVGIFADNSAARKASEAFPSGFVAGSPWVRNLNQVRPSIK
ncbi:hypothetical protein GCM10011297_06480 [Bacterioplanes sanyensis]|uniref:AAA family ATPase n=1 Tax=Bacterioplanes sanyensis TaxID=1249553 RepID=UPI001674F950|nr:AAA family ATPase [Bacterioplanes sanyensis]GGY36119.1 hypothetical protein GCM10011297_06480 [Bacterioplanes sanyensis]